jgi:hypothetical protein
MCLTSPISSHNILVLKGLVVTSSLIFTLCTPTFCRTAFEKHCLMLNAGCLVGFLHLTMVKCLTYQRNVVLLSSGWLNWFKWMLKCCRGGTFVTYIGTVWGNLGSESFGMQEMGLSQAKERWRRWEDNIKMDLQEGGGGRGDWMELAQDMDRWRALEGTVRDFRVP